VKLVVVACNTATAAALGVLRGELEVPVVGVIAPGLRAAVRATRNGRVGVVATTGTICSQAYERENRALGSPVELVCAPCPGFVEAVERGETSGERVRALAEARLGPVRAAGIDTLLLGCTHYPFLARPIADTVGRDVVLVSSAEETAFEVRAILADGALARAPVLPRTTGARALARTGPGPTALDPADDGWAPAGAQHRWCSSGDLGLFAELGRRLLGPELDRVEAVPW
jgi:glutamate racemase